MKIICPICKKEFDVPHVGEEEVFEANCKATKHCEGVVKHGIHG